MMHVCHLTSAHPRYDTRIFVKECRSLAEVYEVSLVVADGLGDEIKEGVRIVDVGKPSGRRARILTATRKVFEKAMKLDAALYHLHDPELLGVGLRLKKSGKKVIFDAHEDLPLQVRNKTYLHPWVRRTAAVAIKHFEAYACRRFDAVVAATPFIRDKFLAINPLVADINNYPIIEELQNSVDFDERENAVCYVGYITAVRGIREMVQAMESTPECRLLLAGKFQEADVEAGVRDYPEWRHVDFLGFLDRDGIAEILRRARAGLVTLHPVPNYLDALPVKMFEYMAAGVPVIASDFPLWRSIVEDAGCGICVDPRDPLAIAGAIRRILENPEASRIMGENGVRAVRETYNWHAQSQKLRSLYAEVLA